MKLLITWKEEGTHPQVSVVLPLSTDTGIMHFCFNYKLLPFYLTEQANSVFQQLVAAYQESKRNHDEEATPTNEAARPLYPTVQVKSEELVETARQKLSSLSMDDSPTRRQSRTLQHQQSISGGCGLLLGQ